MRKKKQQLIVSEQQIIAQDPKEYLSFPDVISDIKNKDKYYLVYRSADAHMPTSSKIHLMMSTNKGVDWREIYHIEKKLYEDGCVWNCPRLSYLPDKTLSIICDTKDAIREARCNFKVEMINLDIKNNKIRHRTTEMKGMVPDRIIPFKNKLLCANHKHNPSYSNLIQMVNWSIDDGLTWHDCNILANDPKHKLCEASIVNFKDKYLLAYLRDNNGIVNPIHIYMSYDGINWKKHGKLPTNGHRIVAILDGNRVVATYRNTKKATMSLITFDLDDKGKMSNCSVHDFDQELEKNMFHFGYSGIIKTGKNEYFVAYYIQKEYSRPYIASYRLTLSS
jgi:hypothetical protein